MLCMSCSRWAGANRYHQGPWGGGPNSNCPYDKSGNRRPGFQFLALIDGYDVNQIQIEHFHDLESEGLTYANPDVNTLQTQDSNNYLIQKALNDF